MPSNASRYQVTTVETTAPVAVPALAAGLTVQTIRRAWFATPEAFRDQRATLLTSRIYLVGRAVWVALTELSLAEVEGILGAVSAKFVVTHYVARRGVLCTTFVNRADADGFVIGKTLHGKPAVVRPLTGEAAS
jgi:hypothetical protein